MRHALRLISVFWAFATVGQATAQTPVVSDEPVPGFEAALVELGADGAATGEAFGLLEPVGGNDGTALINGEIVDPKFYPAIFRKISGSNCTSALIGPAAILTAAHCVDHGEVIRFRANGATARGVCEQAPGYRAGTISEDWAICLLEREVRGIPYENVEIASPPAPNTVIYLTGYGCTVEGVQSDRTLRIGLSKVVRRPGGFGARQNTIFSKSDIMAGGAVLCPGDSGGPAFIIPNGSPTAVRRLVGVNSATTFDDGFSLVASTSAAPGVAFLKDWVRRRGQIVCGVNGGALPNCAF